MNSISIVLNRYKQYVIADKSEVRLEHIPRVLFPLFSSPLTSFITGWKHLTAWIRESPLALSARQASKGWWHDLISSVLRNHLTLSARRPRKGRLHILTAHYYILYPESYIYQTTDYFFCSVANLRSQRRYQVHCLAWQSLTFFSSQRRRSLTIKLKEWILIQRNLWIAYVVDSNLKAKNVKNYLML